MRSEPLSFSHKALLAQKLRELAVPLSEYSFPNLYLFRDTHAYEVVFDTDLFIKGRSYDGRTYLMPTLPADRLDGGRLKDLLQSVDFLFPIPETWFPAFSPDEFDITYNDGDTDYL